MTTSTSHTPRPPGPPAPDQVHGPHAVTWSDESGRQRDWCNGVVYTTDPDRATVGKSIDLANRLAARVQGDGGEFYEKGEDWT